MCHTLKCSVALVTYTYQLLNVINLILELLNAYSWVICNLRKGTSVMSLNPRSYISLEMFDLLKLVLILKALVKKIYSRISPLLSVDPHMENSIDLLKPATDHTTNLSSLWLSRITTSSHMVMFFQQVLSTPWNVNYPMFNTEQNLCDVIHNGLITLLLNCKIMLSIQSGTQLINS